MFHALQGIFCFVTATVSFLYGTRIAWVCGKRCHFHEDAHNRKLLLAESLPAASAVYFFGFVIVFSLIFDGFLTVFIPAIISAILLAHLVVTAGMPDFKRRPTQR
jgi:hypothetical protein